LTLRSFQLGWTPWPITRRAWFKVDPFRIGIMRLTAHRKLNLFQRALAILGLSFIACAPVPRVFRASQGTKSAWKVFHNRAGWSMAYPPGWKIASCQSCTDPAAAEVYVDFFPPSEKNYDEGWVMVQHLKDKPPQKSVDEWLAEIKSTVNLKPVLNELRLTLNGLPALKAVYRQDSDKAWQNEEIYVVADQQTFSVSFSGRKAGGTVETLKHYPIYRKMLSTFRVKH
jgi:hypothetical protein